MKITIYNRIITSIALAILTLSLNSCGTTIWNPADVKDSPINDADKLKKKKKMLMLK